MFDNLYAKPFPWPVTEKAIWALLDDLRSGKRDLKELPETTERERAIKKLAIEIWREEGLLREDAKNRKLRDDSPERASLAREVDRMKNEVKKVTAEKDAACAKLKEYDWKTSAMAKGNKGDHPHSQNLADFVGRVLYLAVH